ncbi:MAG TPA: carboxypeptidase regulatory-like domain-containing protein [Terriglobales bacterium]|nr:carboxypeptidase regulatory-like domain-containing protein [Terriglobales bacterium]
MKSHLKICFLLAMLLAAAVVFAQTSASIVGSVMDPTGAIISGAQVTVINSEKGITRTTASNADGEFGVPALPPGKYDLSVNKSGFKKFEAKGIVLDVAQKARVEVTMEVGAATTEVTVEGSAIAQVETQSSDLGGTVTGKEISQLQLNGRNFTQLVTLVPGVSNQTGQDEGTVGVAGNVSYSINGGRTEYNNWELDGGDNMDNGSNTTLNVYPSLDAIAEFKVMTSNYGAQYGRNGSGTIEVETKSGTNGFHGDVYEFVRNDAFNARNYFETTVPPYKKNDFGYTIGGPIWKDHTYFFWSQEWRRDRVPGQVFNVAVPSAAERQGDFSDLCPNPGTGSTADCPIDPATGQPFPNNQVPFNPNDPNIQGLLAEIPAANAYDSSTGQSFYNASPIQPTNWREELLRVDQALGASHRLTVRYIHDSWDTVNPVPLWTNQGSFPTIQTEFKGPGVSLVTRLTSSFSPTLLNEFVASYTTDHIILTNTGAWQRPSGSTFGTLFPNAPPSNVIPGISLVGSVVYNGGFGQDPGYIPNGPYNSNPTYTFRDNINKIVGKHNLQFGAYFVAAQKNELGGEPTAGSVGGLLTFDTSNAAVTTGNPFADLLLERTSSFGQQDTFVKYYNRYKIFEPYFQDDFRISNRLTLNLGLRVSMFGTYREKQHQAFNFDPAHYTAGQTTLDPSSGQVINLTANGQPASVTNLPNGIVQCGVTPGVPVGCMKGHLFNPAPRLGFAFDPKGDGRWAIRGGYGIFYEHTNGNEANTESLENSPPLVKTATQNNIIGYQNIGSGFTPGTQPVFPLAVVSIPDQVTWPYMQQWHLDIQHQITKNMVTAVSYVGSKGTHLTTTSDRNQLHPLIAAQNPYKQGETFGSNQCGSTLDAYGVPVDATTPSGVPIPYAGPGVLSPAVNQGIAVCGTVADLFRPFPGYDTINYLALNAASNYNALQVGLRRSAGSLQLSVSYTYSHSIDDSSSRQDGQIVDSYDPAANRASSSFDQRHIINAGYVWDLPFFKGTSLTSKLLGGWQYSGIFGFSTGSPFTPGFFIDNAGVANGIAGANAASYPDVISNPKQGITPVPGALQLYNPNAFVAPTALTFGDSARNTLSNPNRTNFDMALFKHFAIHESMALEFRAEAFNVFNHTQFGYVAGDGGSAASNSANLNSNTASCSVTSGPCGAAGNSFLQVLTAHNPRILQLGLKFLF